MDLVKIGFLIKADGLKEANAEVDKLLSRVDKIGSSSKKNASEFENSQKKIKKTTEDSTKANDTNTKSVDRVTKALERQRLIGEYLGKGLDKTTASAIANFRQLGGTTAQVNTLMSSLASNKGLVQAQKDTARLAREQEAQSKAVQKTLAQYERLSRASLGGGVLDSIDRQNKGLADMRKHYQRIEDLQSKQNKSVAETVSKYERLSNKSLGGGILDSIDRQNKGLADMAKYYSNIEAQQKKADADAEKARQRKNEAIQKEYHKNMELLARQTAAEKAAQEKAAQNAEKERQRQIAAAEIQRQAELRGQSGSSTSRDVIGQIKGIAAYALLSTAIYGAITATLNLIGATVRLADEYASTQQRLKLYIKDSETLGQVNTFLAKSAIQNNVGLRENAALYAKLSPAMQRIGANTAATNQVVDAFGKSLRIGGATAMEAASATIQFAQAMASGKLAGDEFRAISEASPRFLKAIADGSGIAAEKLKEMSSAGALTTEVIARALVKEYHNLSKESESLGYTLEQGTNALKTGFMALIGEFNEGAGITKYLGTLMAGMGVDMINTAESAKKSGEAFKEWVTSNSDNINKLVDAFQLLTTFLITRYVVAISLARVESMKLAYQTSALAAAQTTAMRSFVIGATAVTAFGRAAQAAFTFMGGWAGILLTIGGVAATYLLLRDNAAEATQKLVEQSKYVDITTEAYRKLNEEQRLNARSSVANDMNEVNKKLDEQAKAVEGVLKSYVKSRNSSILGMDNGVTDVLDKVTKGVISYDTALRLLSENKKVPRSIVEDFKKEKDIYDETAKAGVKYAEAAKIVGASSKLAGNQAQNATPLITGLADETEYLGDKAEIAGSKFSEFALDLKKAIQDSKDTYDFMVRFDLDEAFAKKLVDRVNQQLAPLQGNIDKAVKAIEEAQKEIDKLDSKDPLRKRFQAQIDKNKATIEANKKAAEDAKKSFAVADAPLVQEAQKEAERVSELSASRRKSDKEVAKSRKEATKDLEKFNDQLLEFQTYYDILKKTNNLEVARIASQKEYINVYKGNLAVATQLAAIQENTRQAESRIEFEKSLRTEEESYTRIVALMKQGADYETAKAVASAKFTDDKRGREAAELAITNALYNQQASLSDQLAQQQNINKYLKDGLGLEEATLRTTLARIAALGDNTNDHEELRRNYEAGLQLLRVAKATSDSQVKINTLTREAALLTTTMANGYGASGVAAAKLAASTVGLLYSQAELQVKKQEEVDLLDESIKNYLTLNSLLSNESQTLREVKATYSTISNEEAKRVETSRKALTIAEAYIEKLKEQKNIPIGDFSNVDFEVFGNFGNPFKEALDGLNAYVSGMTNLDEKIKTVQESMRQYQAEAELASLQGQTQRSQQLLDLANKQIAVEKDLQKEKAATIDIAFGQGLKFAKSFFKEESKGYKIINALEIALQAKKIAFAIWEKKDTLAKYALEIKGMLSSAATFVTTTATKMAAQMRFNVAKGTEAVLNQGSGDPYTAFARMATMAAAVAALGIAIGSFSGGSSGSFEAANNGTGTVFGDTEAQSASIKNSIEILSENSDLMLPLTSAMLRSLRNIESNIGGVTNLILRSELGKGFNVSEGFQQNKLGSLLGGVLGKGVGGLFGTKTTIKGQGLFADTQKLGDIITKGFELQEYVDVQIKKKAFGITTSTKNKTQTYAADADLENQFTLIFSGLYYSILKASTSLGANMDTVENNLKNAVITLGKIDLKGLNGEEIQEKLEAVFGAAADSLAKQAFGGLEDFQTVGEGYYETLVRVATGVEQAAYFTDRLNVTAIAYTEILNKQGDVAAEIVRQSVLLVDKTKDINGGLYDMVNNFEGTAEELTDFVLTLRDLQDQLFMTGKNADYLTSAMILGAGGFEKLSSGFDAYFEMLSPAEQAAELTRRLTNEFAILGEELPADVKAFRNLVNSIDITTEAGQKLYGQIIALAPEFNDLQDALNNANSDVNALVQSLRDLAEQARAARGETEQPRNLAFLRSEFERASILAMQGDTEAANRLPTLGKDLMQVSKLYASSGSEYAKDLAMIQRSATVAADVQANGLGTSISPTLTPSTSTNTTPTVETTNTSTNAKLEAIREEFNAGLFAIAKYTQDMASRFERWDDGSRMMVGIQPETGDQPTPVTVVP